MRSGVTLENWITSIFPWHNMTAVATDKEAIGSLRLHHVRVDYA